MAKEIPTPEVETICETDNFIVWRANEPDGESTYHVELGTLTVHFFEEEWIEFLKLASTLAKIPK
jgi:hypothetical protein